MAGEVSGRSGRGTNSRNWTGTKRHGLFSGRPMLTREVPIPTDKSSKDSYPDQSALCSRSLRRLSLAKYDRRVPQARVSSPVPLRASRQPATGPMRTHAYSTSTFRRRKSLERLDHAQNIVGPIALRARKLEKIP